MKTYYQIFNITNGLDFLINKNWTGEQAFAAVQLLDDLRDQILRRYLLDIADYMDENPDISMYYRYDPDADTGEDGLPF